MTPARRFPFGEEPAATLAQSTAPLPALRPLPDAQSTAPLPWLRPPPDAQSTAPLVDFLPPARLLPFSDSPSAPMAPPAPVSPLVPPLPQPAPARLRVSSRTVTAVVLLVFDVLMVVYLLATWRP